MQKIIKKLSLAGAVLILLSAIALFAALSLSLPKYSGELALRGMEQPVHIRFDRHARPFVRAQSLADALFAEGYLHGSERLWQMELLRRAGRGRLAQLFGDSMLATDRELWRMRVPMIANTLQANASERFLRLVDAYVAGVNGALQGYTLAPPEFLLLGHRPEPWQREDVFAIGALMGLQSGRNFRHEILRLALREKVGDALATVFQPDDGEQADFPYILQPDNGGERGGALSGLLSRLDSVSAADTPLMPRFAFGSNGWVVAPERSASGRALFAFDSHDALGLPNLFYEVHLFFGDDRQLRGWSVPGLPGVINGFNEHIAWGFTNIGDTQDLFTEVRSAEDPLRFRDGDQWYRAQTQLVEIPVRGRSQPEVLELVTTRNGPLISEAPALSLAWTMLHLDGHSLESIIDLNLAPNWQAFTAALDRYPGPTLNATFADVDGNIGFRTAGLIPLRGRGEGLEPLPGHRAQNRWRGLVPPAQMPEIYNPPQGYLAAANARVNPRGLGPLVSADNAPRYRIERIQQQLSSQHDLTVDDMRRLQFDWHDGQASLLLPALLGEVEPRGLDAVEQAALAQLQDWQSDPVADTDQAAPLVFQVWYRELARGLFLPELGEDLQRHLFKYNYVLNHALDRLILRERDSAWWRDSRSGLITAAFRAAVGQVRAAQGEDVALWRLGAQHRLALHHELSGAVPLLGMLFDSDAHPWGGSTATVGRASYRYSGSLDVSMGATVRVVAELRDTPEVRAVIPGGQSGHPLGDHYLDQLPYWLQGRLLPVVAEPADRPDRQLLLLPAR
ncbi:penicillin acylase family protein [Microbulbifer marinus]|uniref:Penicillin amidase n=1 Tax=Microbulbifer marinus TaxID=658218 RepID=A0A1H4A135_9GAMM|nr:penicillin acylase family protein [Microbulbifer marinus]SEA29749.1 penicillin amidase [Microbulbifer marinus]